MLCGVLKTWLTCGLLVGLPLITTAANSAAQDRQGLMLQRAVIQQCASSRLHQSEQVPTSGPTWTLLLPSFSTSELFFETLLSEHSAVYDSGTNTMIVFGGLDQSDNLLLPGLYESSETLIGVLTNCVIASQTQYWRQELRDFVRPITTLQGYSVSHNYCIPKLMGVKQIAWLLPATAGSTRPLFKSYPL